MTGTRPSLPPPPDQDQRDLILSLLDRNVLVEAGAGTGKTTSMVGRMVALLRTGACADIRTLASVTFTRKAAAELRGRFQLALERGAASGQGPERQRLQAALGSIELCFIGTIHSFCARLLRERPVEARVDLAFEELDQDADRRLRQEAWDDYVARRHVSDPDLLLELEQRGLELGSLEPVFLEFADYPDVDQWPAPAGARLPALEPVAAQVLSYVERMRTLRPDLPDPWGNDRLIPEYRRLPRIIPHFTDLSQPTQLMEALQLFTGKRKVVLKVWKQGGRFTADDARQEQERWSEFREQVALPTLERWYELRYATVMRVLFGARQAYDERRRRRGRLNYQDLLLKAADLLRDRVHVREYFAERFTHLLVDEFQDTDPIQAEVMLLLTADDPAQPRWRRCVPRPGSLFVVGDPKQSIYRFRRADIVTYNEVKRIIAQQGQVVHLSANFRTTRAIVDWVNRAFARRFPEETTDASPRYVPLQVGRVDGNPGELSGVFALQIPDEASGSGEQVIAFEADLIARTIRRALDQGLQVPRTRSELERGMAAAASPDDFMIVTRKRFHLSEYARRLQAYGVPHVVTGGQALGEVAALGLLHACLGALVQPDNPVALVAALRSELFGISDVELFAYRQAGGEFRYRAARPDGLSPGVAALFDDAFARLRRYESWFNRLPALSALELILDDLGLFVLASGGEGGDVEAGSLAKGLELLRAAQRQAWSVRQLADHLGQVVALNETHDGISALSAERPAVRLMNLHKVKGLEAPVVFLADPTGHRQHGISLHVDRAGDDVQGYMAIHAPKVGFAPPRPVALPGGWSELEARERRFLEAEELRLQYVAATRAGAMMVISRRTKRSADNPWHFFADPLARQEELADPGPQLPAELERDEITPEQVTGAREQIAARGAAGRAPTFGARAAKSHALAGPAPRRVSAPTPPEPGEEGEHGVEWGTAIHRLLQLAMQNPRASLFGPARRALRELDLEPRHAEAAVSTVRAVTRSDIWRRARGSGRQLVEVPFQILAPPRAEASPLILRGVIDLVFREEGGWVVVDYKTDLIGERTLEDLTAAYAPQVALYADAWRRATGEPVKESGLFFTRAGRYCPLA